MFLLYLYNHEGHEDHEESICGLWQWLGFVGSREMLMAA
jgi:hypothetical protein